MRIKTSCVLQLIILVLSFNVCADEYDDSLVDRANVFLSEEYSLLEITNPESLIRNWNQIEGIDLLTFMYKEKSAHFSRTNAAPHMLHKWANQRASYAMLNHNDPVVYSLVAMIENYRYFLRLRLNDGNGRPYQGDTYYEAKHLVINAGRRLATLVDQKYTDAKILRPEKVIEF